MASIDHLLKVMKEKRSSELHIMPGMPPCLRIDGNIIFLKSPPLTLQEAEMICESTLLSETQRRKFTKESEIKYTFSVKRLGLFRANLFNRRGITSGIYHAIPSDIPSFKELNLPEVAKSMSGASSGRGLILISGPLGSGKSTTLAAILDAINANIHGHIITIEDPIQYPHPHKSCIVNQIEINSDTSDFNTALKGVHQLNPDVIALDGIMDYDSIENMITLSASGPLVLATFCSNSCIQTINNIIGMFPADKHPFIRGQLSSTLIGVLCHKLLERAHGGGMILCLEIMIPNLEMRNIIHEGKLSHLYSYMKYDWNKSGMITFNQSLLNLFIKKYIKPEDVLVHNTDNIEIRELIEKQVPRKDKRHLLDLMKKLEKPFGETAMSNKNNKTRYIKHWRRLKRLFKTIFTSNKILPRLRINIISKLSYWNKLPIPIIKLFQSIIDFWSRLKDRRRFPRSIWFPVRDKPDLKEDEHKRQHEEVSKIIRNIFLTIISFGFFCILTLSSPDSELLGGKINIPFADIPISTTLFMTIGPLVLIVLTIYLHIFIEKLINLEGIDENQKVPYIFNISNIFAYIISFSIFYLFTPLVLIAFSWKNLPSPGYQPIVMIITTFSTIIAMIFIKIRRIKEERRGWRNRILFLMMIVLTILTYYDMNLRLKGKTESALFLRHLNLSRADLSNKRFREQYLFKANLSGADMRGADLRYANLRNANLEGADLKNADLNYSNLKNANLREAIGIECDQLRLAIGWQDAYRDSELACGAKIPEYKKNNDEDYIKLLYFDIIKFLKKNINLKIFQKKRGRP